MVLLGIMEDGTSMSLRHICNTEAAQEVRRILDLVGDKWSLLVIRSLMDGRTKRFMELRREVDPISQRMLTLTLRQLERDGLITRTIYPEVPPRVEYQLTCLGATLQQSVMAIVNWTLANREAIQIARDQYDRRTGLIAAAAD